MKSSSENKGFWDLKNNCLKNYPGNFEQTHRSNNLNNLFIIGGLLSTKEENDKIRENFIIPGQNDQEQVLSGAYFIETSPERGKVFWTERIFQGFLKPKGDEQLLIVSFATGRKKEETDSYKVKIVLINEQNKSIITEHISDYPQQNWQNLELPISLEIDLDLVRVMIKSDTFSPSEIGDGEDTRQLGILIQNISLK